MTTTQDIYFRAIRISNNNSQDHRALQGMRFLMKRYKEKTSDPILSLARTILEMKIEMISKI